MIFRFISLLAVGLLILIGFLSLAPKVSAFDFFGKSCEGEAAKSSVCKDVQTQNQKNENPIVKIIHTAANILALVAGIAAVIMIIISGYTFVTAGGSIGGQRAGDSPTRAKEARAKLMYAIIGLIVIALAWSVITFVTNRVIQT